MSQRVTSKGFVKQKRKKYKHNWNYCLQVAVQVRLSNYMRNSAAGEEERTFILQVEQQQSKRKKKTGHNWPQFYIGIHACNLTRDSTSKR